MVCLTSIKNILTKAKNAITTIGIQIYKKFCLTLLISQLSKIILIFKYFIIANHLISTLN